MLKLFNLTLQLNRFPIKKAQVELNKIIALSEKEHHLFVENKKNEIVNFHLQNNTFYQELVGSTSFKKWDN